MQHQMQIIIIIITVVQNRYLDYNIQYNMCVQRKIKLNMTNFIDPDKTQNDKTSNSKQNKTKQNKILGNMKRICVHTFFYIITLYDGISTSHEH